MNPIDHTKLDQQNQLEGEHMPKRNTKFYIPDIETSNFTDLTIILENVAVIGRLKNTKGDTTPIVQLNSGMSIFLDEKTYTRLQEQFDLARIEEVPQVWYDAFPPVTDEDEESEEDEPDLDNEDLVPV